jgi:hypothetical protein
VARDEARVTNYLRAKYSNRTASSSGREEYVAGEAGDAAELACARIFSETHKIKTRV